MFICENIKDIIKSNLENVISLRDKKQMKPDGSYVSEGDLLMERKIMEYVSSLGSDYYLISEEKDNSDFNFDDWETAIIVDPIDGTENFVSGLKEWGVGVSVYRLGLHLESLIALPELDIYKKSGDTFQKYDSRIYGISSSLTKKDIEDLEEGYEYRIIGCSMYNMYNAITGSYAVFQNPKGVSSWDILPGLNLALENNCKTFVEGKEYNGEFLPPNRKYRIKIEQ
jgi:fructose-1,6-bisphosphatase/inositol monophosphatase family enzyme